MMLNVAFILPLFSIAPLESPSQVVAELAGENPDAAIEKLIVLEPETTLHLLVTCVREKPVDYAWQAGRALRRIAEAKPRDRAWKETTAALGLVLLDEKAAADNRLIAGLALRGHDKTAKPMFKDIAQLLAAEAPGAVHLGGTLALAGLGSGALGNLKSLMKGEGLRKLMWSATAITCGEKDGKKLKGTLVKLIEDRESLSAFLACRSSLHALTGITDWKAADKALDKRLSQKKVWSGGIGVNFGGVSMVREGAVEGGAFQLSNAGKFRIANVKDLNLPSGLDDPMSGSAMRLSDVLQCFSGHLTSEAHALEKRFEKGEFKTFSEWNKAAAPLIALAELLDSVEKCIPADE